MLFVTAIDFLKRRIFYKLIQYLDF